MPEIDTSPPALRALAGGARKLSERNFGDTWADYVAVVFDALAAEKEAPTVKPDLTVRADAPAGEQSGISGESLADQDALTRTLRASLASAEQERDALRDALVCVCNATDGCAAAAVSTEFLLKVPAEVEACIAKLRARAEKAERDAADRAISARFDAADGNWSQAAAEAARAILCLLGWAQSPSMEPGSDDRRDRVAKIIEAAMSAAIARAEKAEAERDALQGWQPIETAPENTWLRTKRAGEAGENVSKKVVHVHPEHCPEPEIEWVDRGGRTTVTHHSFLEPTHWLPLAARKPCDPADPCAFAQDLASENRTLDGLLAEAKERAEEMRVALAEIRDMTPYAANTVSADGHHEATASIARAALAEKEAGRV